jgi:hypothetical protein
MLPFGVLPRLLRAKLGRSYCRRPLTLRLGVGPILWWAKAAALISAAGIVVAVAIAALSYVWSAK